MLLLSCQVGYVDFRYKTIILLTQTIILVDPSSFANDLQIPKEMFGGLLNFYVSRYVAISLNVGKLDIRLKGRYIK